MHKVFISYHHANDQYYKDALISMSKNNNLFIDKSVNTGDIPDNWDDKKIRIKIRDEYLKDSTVTIVLIGFETKNRKHIDWEIYSSMYDGINNKKSGIIAIYLPSVEEYGSIHIGHGQEEKDFVYPHIKKWTSIYSRESYESYYPYLPARLIDNLLEDNSHISVTKWNCLDANKLNFLIDVAFRDRVSSTYTFLRPMRKRNS